MIKIINDNGRIWCVSLTGVTETSKSRDATVDFYDCRYEHTEFGQFVSSYYLETILEHAEGVGLDLNCGIPDWKISGKTMDRIILWLKEVSK